MSNFTETSRDTSINHEDIPHDDTIKLKFDTVLQTFLIHFQSFIFAYIFSSLRLFFTLLMDHRNWAQNVYRTVSDFNMIVS